MSVEAFFAYARERQSVLLRRRAGQPAPWTTDPIIHQYRFCNVHREDDRVTIWLREHVRDRLRDQPEVLLAVVLFRWFNRISTGEAMFQQPAIGLGGEEPGETAWDAFLRTGDEGVLRAAVLSYCGDGPYVTGSYIIQGWRGMNKLDGVLECVRNFMARELPMTIGGSLSPATITDGWHGVAQALLRTRGETTLEQVWEWLRQFEYMGDFMAYEVVTDLRWTALLDQAPDVMTWANPGPGAARGLGRVFEANPDAYHPRQKEKLCEMMRTLLHYSQSSQMWPQPRDGGSWHDTGGIRLPEDAHEWNTRGGWPAWDMRTVEHTLCEFDKYERMRLGEGKMKGVYRHG